MSATDMPRMTAVLVLYRLEAQRSPCFLSLKQAVATMSLPPDRFTLLLYDNSTEASILPDFPANIRLLHNPTNGGVAAAYNAGLHEARTNGSRWLLLLDQDTALTSEYLDELRRSMETVPADVVAIIPRLVQDGHTHSPQHLPRLSHRPFADSLAGKLEDKVSAFNSGAAVRVDAIRQFPGRYWLDFLDHAVFHELQASDGRIWLMHARLEHRLSTQRLGEEASVSRYLNVLQAERDFYQQYGSAADKLFYRLRRTKQTAGQLLKVPDKRFALLSARAALGLLPATPARQQETSG